MVMMRSTSVGVDEREEREGEKKLRRDRGEEQEGRCDGDDEIDEQEAREDVMALTSARRGKE
jgi:hypothetical protein